MTGVCLKIHAWNMDGLCKSAYFIAVALGSVGNYKMLQEVGIHLNIAAIRNNEGVR